MVFDIIVDTNIDTSLKLYTKIQCKEYKGGYFGGGGKKICKSHHVLGGKKKKKSESPYLDNEFSKVAKNKAGVLEKKKSTLLAETCSQIWLISSCG
jgi:hypothetical protein